jgi:hypothetical protein
MTNGYWSLTLVLLTVAVAVACGWLYGHVMWKEGHEAGRLHEQNRQNTRRIRENRARPPATSLAGGRPPWYTTVTPSRLAYGGIGGPSTLPIPSQRARRFPAAVTATGELVRLTDEHIARMQADEAAYRQQMRQEISA